jgi:hypothetical protein
MLYIYVFGGLILYLGLCVLADYATMPWHLRERAFPKGTVHEYATDGIHTYKHQQ